MDIECISIYRIRSILYRTHTVYTLCTTQLFMFCFVLSLELSFYVFLRFFFSCEPRL